MMQAFPEQQTLASFAAEVLGQPYYDALLHFFEEVFSRGKLIVFVTRRCSCLGALFLKILKEKGTIDTRGLRCLTDSALIDSGYEIGENLYQTPPEILLVDDSIAYGRAVRSVLEAFLDRVIEGFRIASGSSEENAEELPLRYVQSKVEVCVFAKKKQCLVLPSFYHRPVNCVKSYSNAEWNEFSNRLSELVNAADVANSAFVLSAGTNEKPALASAGGWIPVTSTYRKWTQTAWFLDHSVAIYSVRQIQCGFGHRYRYIPFVFLPTLSGEALRRSEEDIFLRISQGCDGDSEFQALCRNVHRQRENTTARRRMEFLTMYLSHSLLFCFAEEWGLPLADAAFDCDKIAWNYARADQCSEESDALRLLASLCTRKYQKCLLSKDELVSWSARFQTSGELRSFALTDRCLDESEQAAIEKTLEDRLFKQGIQAERLAHSCIARNSSPGDATLDNLNVVRNDSLFAFMNQIFRKSNCNGIPYFLSYMFQMMDCGAMSVVVSENKDASAQNETAEQSIRVCEQAFFLLPRRYAHCMDALIALDRYSSFPMEEKRAQVEHFAKWVRGKKTEKPEFGEDLCFLLHSIEKSAQHITDWDIRLNRHFVVEGDSDKPAFAVWDFEEEERQRTTRRIYEDLWKASQENYDPRS